MDTFYHFVIKHWALSAAFLFILMLLVMAELRRKALGFKEVNPTQAVQLMNHDQAVVIDVREEQEYQSGHIVGALHVPVGLLESRVNELNLDQTKPIIVYCRTGQRAATAGVALSKMGFVNVSKLSGGVLAWQSASLPLEKGKA